MDSTPEKIDSREGTDNKGFSSAAAEKNQVDRAAVISPLPHRYIIKDANDGRILTCLETPNIAVHIEAGLSISASAARKSSPGAIYLDGAAQSEPFMDHEKQIYNFDHHEGCLRPFTLSTCEQVLVMIFKGLDLRGRDWKVFANEPDLDTILAIWLILNHLRIQKKDSGRLQFLYTLVRLEGIIDSHGLEMTGFSGLPPELIKKTKKVIDYLRAEEIDLKKNAIWEEIDLLEHTALILQKIDRIIYRSNDLADFKELRELSRVELGGGRIAVVVEADLGIYELEPHLQRVYGESIGLVILKKGEGLYTLRRLDPFMPGDLNDVYRILNYIDPAVRCRPNSNQWGGSGDIGGSPRGISTKLSPAEIAQACRDAFQNPSPAAYVIHFIYALMAVIAIVGAAAASDLYLSSGSWLSKTPGVGLVSKTYFSFFGALVFFTAVVIFLISRRRLWRFGFGVPHGKDWWICLPVVLLAAMANGVYFPNSAFQLLNFKETVIYVFIVIPLASELLFRGLAYGILAGDTTVQSCNTPWSFSYAAVAAAVLYAGFITGLTLLPEMSKGVFQMKIVAETAFAAFALGLANGIVRERSRSIFPAVAFHALAFAVFFL
jgi:membrane protease YdiL (CAAX protease family)